MGIPVSVESVTGYSKVFVQTQEQAGAEREKERTTAVRECQRLARELEQPDPVRAAELDAAAADARKTARDLYGLIKLDGRQPLEAEATERVR